MDWGVGHYETTAAQLEPAAQIVVERAGLRPGERVLDLGCGTGNGALAAARAGADVVAVDPAERLREVALTRARAEGLGIRVAAGDAGAIPLPDASIDAALSVFAVIFAPDPLMAAAELARVVVPTGRIVLSTWLPRGPIHEMMTVSNTTVAAALGAPAPSPGGFAWHSRDDLRTAFGPYGFDVVIEEHDLAFAGPSVEEYVDAEQRNHPLAVGWRAMFDELGRGEEVTAQIRAAQIAVLAAANEDPNGFRVTSPFVVVTMERVAG